MINKENILKSARSTFLSESLSISKVIEFLDDTYVNTIEVLYNCKGRIIISGIGKSAIIAQKIAATMNSTGSPAFFLHASEAIHGDLGMLLPQDVFICISKSGNSSEIKQLINIVKQFGNTIIAITGNTSSYLALNSNFILNTTVESESCPFNLAPTNSTTAQLVMGDALAISLMQLKKFKVEDFAKYHPGGTLGKRLLLKVRDMMHNALKPMVFPLDSIKKVIFEISDKRLGVAVVIDNDEVIGIITDGDIRRMLNVNETFNHLSAKDIMTKKPKLIQANDSVTYALKVLEDHKITQLIVLEDDIYIGVLHLHDILKEGIV